jgi:acetyltransferase-like isoleucine patch superfamily enzyme
MAYFSENELSSLGFKSIGRNVKISSKASIYDPGRIEIGDHSRIDDFCVISGKVTIGRNVHIAVFCNIAGGEKGVFIEDFAGVSYASQVFSQSDDYSGAFLTGATVPARYTKVTRAPVVIRRHSIVGASSVILPGVTLEEGSSIGAMSLVTRSTEPWSVYLGIPARKIKDRARDMLDLEAAYLAEENSS